MSKLFEEKVQVDVRRAVRRHKKRLQDISRVNPRSPEIKKEVNRFVKETLQTTRGHLTEYGASQLTFHTNSLHKGVGKVYEVKPPRKSTVLTNIIGTNIKGDTSLSTQFSRIGDNELKRIDGIVNRGVASSLSNKEISSKIARTTKITENQASALVRTSITRSTNLAQSEVMQANSGIMKGYQFTAILDTRTSDICKFHDGIIYPYDDTIHLPPLHWRCRSTVVPITKSFNELLDTKDPRIKKKVVQTLPASQRTKLDGRSVAKEGYGNWLRRQAYEVKLRHFGNDNERVKLFDEGNLPVKKFFTTKGKSISLNALRRLDTAATVVVTQRRSSAELPIPPVKAIKPQQLIANKALADDLRDFYVTEASHQNALLSLVDYKGTSIPGKRQSRRSANNVFDERTQFVDPITGETKNSWLYDPDFNVYQERIDFLKASKILKDDQKVFIEDFVTSLDDKMSVNQQSAVLENMRLNFERYYDPSRKSYRQDWDNLDAIIRSEMKNSVVNTSRILDRRSRSRAQQFDMYGAGDSQAAIQINGKWMTFDELSSNLDADRKFQQEWKRLYGNPLARKSYFTGRAPLRLYFETQFKGIKKPDKFIKDVIKDQPGGELLLSKLEGRPIKSFPEKIKDQWKKEMLEIFDREISLRNMLVSAREDFFKGKLNDGSIDALADAFQLAASGTATDYDSLAISMGKLLYEKHPLKVTAGKKNAGRHILGAPTLENYHKQGSSLLRMMEDRRMIKVTPRGVTRRAVTDLETGRPDGSWRDTVSREVIILDKNLKELQLANKRVDVATRIGIVNKRDELIIDVDSKNYKTRKGRKTGDAIITRRANSHYDKMQIDKDISNEINWANKGDWEVDKDYSDFMLDLVRFRDPRGNVKKYDDLNGIRQIILQRGDMGLGMMQTVKWHRDRGKSFKIPHQIDSRGRIYAKGYLTPTGGEFVRPFLNTGRVSKLGPDGYFAFQEQVGSLIGPAGDALTNRGRFKIFRDNRAELIELGRKLQSKTQRDRRIREVLEHPLVQGMDAEEHPKLLRFALETARMDDHLKGDWSDTSILSTFKTQLPIEIDASASGAQIIALSTKNKALAFESNVIATPKKNRLYDIMAQDAVSDPRFKALGRLPSDLTWEDLSKAAKAQNMVSFYGAGAATQRGSLADKFAKELLKRDHVVVTRRRSSNTPKDAFSQLELNKLIDEQIKLARAVDATETVRDLTLLKRELNDVIDKDAPVGSKLRALAKDVHVDVEEFVERVSGTHAGIVGPNEFKVISDVMSEHLTRRAPVTEKFISFWKGVAQDYVIETNKVDIPWVTFDNKVLRQRYRPTVETHINFIDPNTGRRVRNIYRDKVEDGKLLGKGSITDARTGLGVNGNHSNDAAIVRQFHLWGRDKNVHTATIHDAFFVNMGEATRAKAALRHIYADAVDSDTIIKTLAQMRRDGMSKATHDKLIKKAVADGLIPPSHKALTRDEILKPLEVGESWYGIGP